MNWFGFGQTATQTTEPATQTCDNKLKVSMLKYKDNLKDFIKKFLNKNTPESYLNQPDCFS